MLVRGLLADVDAADDHRHLGVRDRPGGAARVARHDGAALPAGAAASSSSPACAPGVPVLMDNPREVGADRIINALAAATLYGGPAIVVDFGTATTFDVVSGAGRVHRRRHRPRHRDLARGARPPRRPAAQGRAARPRSVIAKNTVEALQSGMIFGVAAPGRGDRRPDDRRARCGGRRRHGDRDRPSRAAAARRVRLLHRARAVAHPPGACASSSSATPECSVTSASNM